jgi:hypothetical protein
MGWGWMVGLARQVGFVGWMDGVRCDGYRVLLHLVWVTSERRSSGTIMGLTSGPLL